MIIGLHGYPRSGKDLCAKILEPHGFRRIAFADALRDGLLALNPTVMGESRTFYKLQDLVGAFGWEGAKSFPEVRELLQRFGTEAGREIHGDDCWVNIVEEEIMRSGWPDWVITDVRFENEVAACDFVIHLIRPGFGPVNKHKSEEPIDPDFVDINLFNDGDMADLEWGLLRAINILRKAEKYADN